MVLEKIRATGKTKVNKDAECDLILDTEIDKLLEEKAEKTNLTVFNVKSIIRRILKDETVQKIVRLQSRKESKSASADNQESEASCDSQIEELLSCYEPKLTRAKTKELIQNNDQSQLPNWPISPAKFLQFKPLSPNESQVPFAAQELPDDSEAEDDEYIPKETDLHPSDDDASVTSISDIGSPATPSSSRSTHPMFRSKRRRLELFGSSSSSSRVTSNDDSVFKTPSPQKLLKVKHDNAIGLRTRSKLPLNDTPLEDLEKQLIPPDITTDMYEWNESDNEDYLKFLQTFTFSSIPEGNDDDEADPEYNVMEDEDDEQDQEEHRDDRAVKVSKKELNDLITELFDEYEGGELEDLTSSFTQNLSSKSVSTQVQHEKVVTANAASATLQTVESTATSGGGGVIVFGSPAPKRSAPPISCEISTDVADGQVEQDMSSKVMQSIPPLYAVPYQPRVIPNPPPLQPAPLRQEPGIAQGPKPLFHSETFLTLRQQIEKHIQLLTTTYVISSGLDNPQVVKSAHSAKSMLFEIASSAESSGPNSAYAGRNLKPALEVLKNWPPRMHSSSPIKKKILEEHGYKSSARSQNSEEKGRELSEHEKKIVTLIGTSSAFMYPTLLPSVFTPSSQPVVAFTFGEDSLIARGMHELKSDQMLKTYSVAALLSEVLIPIRTSTQIFNRIRNVKKMASTASASATCFGGSPLRDYFVSHKVPTAPYEPYLPSDAYPPIRHPPETLSLKWQGFTLIMINNNVLEQALYPKTLVIMKKTLAKPKTKKKLSKGKVKVKEEKDMDFTSVSSSFENSLLIGQDEVTSTSEFQTFTVTNDDGELQFHYTVPMKFVKPNVMTGVEEKPYLEELSAAQLPLEPVQSSDISPTLPSFAQFVEEDVGSTSNTGVSPVDAGESGSDNKAIAETSSADSVLPSSAQPTETDKDIHSGRNYGSSGGGDDEDDKDKKKKCQNESIYFDDHAAENTETTDEDETESTSDHVSPPINIKQKKPKKDTKKSNSNSDKIETEITQTASSSSKRKKRSSGSVSNIVSPRSGGSGGSKRHKYNTAPVEQLLETNTQDDTDVINAFSEAFLLDVRQKVDRKNPSLYPSFLQILCDCAANDSEDDVIYRKVEELFKDFPEITKEFGGLQSAEAAFRTGNFTKYQETHAQLYFLQLLEKWTVNCPQMKTKLIQRLKSLQDENLTEAKVLDAMHPFFSQSQNMIVADAFKALFPSIFRPQTSLSEADFEDIELDVEDNSKPDSQSHPLPHVPLSEMSIEMDEYETVKLPEEKQIIATNSCPCGCHEDPNNVPFHTRAKHCQKCCVRDGKLFLHSGRVMKPVSIGYMSPELNKQVLAPATYTPRPPRPTSAPATAARKSN